MSAPIPLIVLTNGRRDCISQTIPSIRKHLAGVVSITIIDGSNDPGYQAWLREEFGLPLFACPLGYWRAMQSVWRYARGLEADAIAFWEDDFVLTEDVDLTDLSYVLGTQPHLTQIALLRQPWFTNEVAQGGLIPALEAQGQQFTEQTDGAHSWIEHRACFTGNPSLIPRGTFERDWPEGAWSESQFGRLLFADPHARGAYWGRRSDPPRVEHIGRERVGHDY